MFSELCDDIVQRSGRLDRLANGDIPAYVTASIQEAQSGKYFYKDGVEDTVAVSLTDPTIWTFPRTFRKLLTAQYPDGTFPDRAVPGKGLIPYIGVRTGKGYYYAASTYIVFNSVANTVFSGNPSNNINLYYFTWLPRLRYYPVGKRPATFDDVLQTYTYFDLSSNTDPDNNLNYNLPQNQPIAQARITNWLLLYYREFIAEGALAKLYKAVKDDTRAVTSYSLWLQYKKKIEDEEAYVALME